MFISNFKLEIKQRSWGIITFLLLHKWGFISYFLMIQSSKCIIYNYGVNVIIKRTENKCVIYNLSERIYKQDEAKGGGGNSVL